MIEVTFIHYNLRRKSYNKELTNHNQPLLIHRPKQKREPNRQGRVCFTSIYIYDYVYDVRMA
jgi:hypothetical protein